MLFAPQFFLIKRYFQGIFVILIGVVRLSLGGGIL